MLKYLSINLSTWAISKTLGWRNGHPQIWKGPIATTRLHKKDIWQTWGASLAGKNNDLLDSRAEAALPFWSRGIFAARLWAKEVLLEEVLCKSLFPNASMDSQLVRQPPLHSHSIASSPARAYKPECYGGWQLSGPLQARTCARKNVR